MGIHLIKCILHHLNLNNEEKLQIALEFLQSIPEDEVIKTLEDLKDEIGKIYYDLSRRNPEKAEKFIMDIAKIHDSERIKETLNRIIIEYIMDICEN